MEPVELNPFQQLVKSRKFWLAVLDAALSTLATVLGWIFAPDKATAIMALVVTWQPVIIAVIVSYTVQNVEGIKADKEIATAQIYNEKTEPLP